MAIPQLLTFDIFGTVVDWHGGLSASARAAGADLRPGDFDRLIDLQGAMERRDYQSYADIVEASLVEGLKMPAEKARQIATRVGDWPLFPDARDALARLMRVAPVIAMTNSDRAHGEQVRSNLGFRLSDWICAEDTRCYKPARAFWDAAAVKAGVPFGDHWWHVSAYADYDLEMAKSLGLTCVLITRPHARAKPGIADLTLPSLGDLADKVEIGGLS